MSLSAVNAIKTLAKSNDEIYSIGGKVLSVDMDKNVCDVQPVTGGAVYDVLLQAVEGNEEGFILIPAVGSDVIITFLSPVTAYVAVTTSITEMVGVIGQSRITLNNSGVSLEKDGSKIIIQSTGIEISRNGVSLSTVLNQVLDAMAAITVGTPSGVSTPPLNATQILGIKPLLSQILT